MILRMHLHWKPLSRRCCGASSTSSSTQKATLIEPVYGKYVTCDAKSRPTVSAPFKFLEVALRSTNAPIQLVVCLCIGRNTSATSA